MEHSGDIILKAEKIVKSFGGVHALKGVDLEIRRGEIHCLAGENGCGKSTLIKIISGDYVADSGSITLNGTRYTKLTPIESIGEGVQVIYQDFAVFPNLTVMENIAATQTLMEHKKTVNWKHYREIAQEAVSKIGFSIDFDERVENLSVANKQLVAISRALLMSAKLIIMDEPTTALTKKEVAALFKIIKNLQASGISILFVSHKMDEVYEICDRLTVFRNGENVITTDIKEVDQKKFAYYMTGREFKQEQYTCAHPGETVLEVQDLGLPGAYEDISFCVRKGDIYGITGLLGSGRTELALSLFGMLRAKTGRILIGGKQARIHSVADAQKYGIGYVPEDRATEALFLPQSIENNMIVSVLDSYTDKNGVYHMGALRRLAEEWRESLHIKIRRLSDPVSSLSGGNQQKVVLAKWLASDLRVLILNGPTVGVDIGSKYDIHQILRDLAAQGIAIIMISDDLSELLPNCNRMMIMRGGRTVCEMDTSSTTEREVANIISDTAARC